MSTSRIMFLEDRLRVLEATLEAEREKVRALERLLVADTLPMLGVGLTGKETAILRALYTAPAETVVSKERLIAAVYALTDDLPEPKIVDVFICKIRKKIRPIGLEIETVWGDGHRLTAKTRAALDAMRQAGVAA